MTYINAQHNYSNPPTICTYTKTIPMDTPRVTFYSGIGWDDACFGTDPARCRKQWATSISASSGGLIYQDSGLVDSTLLPGQAEWTAWCYSWMCTYYRGSVVALDTSALTESGSVDLTFTMTASGAGGDMGSLWYVGTIVLTPGVEILDPVPDLISGTGVVTHPETLARMGKLVIGVAADGAARVVLRIPANLVGEDLTITLLNDLGQASSSTEADGRLTTIEGVDSGGQLQVTAVDTSQGPLAFAIYRPPTNFSRSGQDDNAERRHLSFRIDSLDVEGFTQTVAFDLLRPPVVLVHGLWGDPVDWNGFTPFINDSRFFIRRATYNYPLAGLVAGSVPGYSASVRNRARTNALGFAFNAPLVESQIEKAIIEFREVNAVAAAQADVVAHSMGGTVARTLENLDDFTDWESFGIGNIHKLITIGTPHLGSPLATQLIQVDNTCTRNVLAMNKSVSFFTADLSGVGTVRGGVGDLQGDGWGGGLSTALAGIQNANGHEVPTAMIAGTMTAANLAGLDCTLCAVSYLRFLCGGDPLAGSLTVQGWPTVFGQPSDAIVPRTSQYAGQTGPEVLGVVHTSALVGWRGLGFNGPGELDQAGNVPARVVQLLNAPVQASDFYPLP
ncbi:MAG: esterase/lipase family protein [Bryobacteraceae bacterium]